MAIMRFGWDENKRKSNLAKHGIDFLKAILVFSAPCYEGIDIRAYDGETRFYRIGEANGQLLLVVYVERDQIIRIISARKARADERRKYFRLLFGSD
jgi:uncharacterized protein